jgi:hypothetical protein
MAQHGYLFFRWFFCWVLQLAVVEVSEGWLRNHPTACALWLIYTRRRHGGHNRLLFWGYGEVGALHWSDCNNALALGLDIHVWLMGVGWI